MVTEGKEIDILVVKDLNQGVTIAENSIIFKEIVNLTTNSYVATVTVLVPLMSTVSSIGSWRRSFCRC